MGQIRHTGPAAPAHNERGVALLLVLWIITFLSVICAEFSWTMRTEIATVTNFKEGVQAYYMAEAGINKAIIELMRSVNQKGKKNKKTDTEEDEEDALEEQYWEPGGGPYRFSYNGAKCEVSIEDDNNKVGLNAVLKKAKKNPTFLKNLLEEQVGLEGEERDIVADSLIDWHDTDHNVTGVHGAEKEYYESLDQPYGCRNGFIPVLDELVLVRGIDEKMFYGDLVSADVKTSLTREELETLLRGEALEGDLPDEDEESWDNESERKVNPGLVNIFSVFSSSSTIKPNVNSATVEQLMLVMGITLETAREIVIERRERQYANITDRLPQFANYAVWSKKIKVGRAGKWGNYRVRARGFSPDERISRSITCDMMLTGSNCYILSWKAED
ncbi:MAG: hypothetical protein GY868_04685 [Deltaproteobacteria bacterium]|nr:hypothetical protein [Deltaproteobacteria bacterium]